MEVRWIALFIMWTQWTHARAQECTFPESDVAPFFFDIRADTPEESVIVDTVVEPPQAALKVLDVRSNNLQESFTDHFYIDTRQNGQFMVINRKVLTLPSFPSPVNETLLFLTVSCNGNAYPLITIRVRNYNSFAPEFYGQPYEIIVPNNAPIGSMFETPVIAVDKDPSELYSVTYEVEGNTHRNELDVIVLDDERIQPNDLPAPFRSPSHTWSSAQLPPIVKIQVRGQLTRRTYYFNISANDHQTESKRSYALLKVSTVDPQVAVARFSQRAYYANFTKAAEVGSMLVTNQPIIAIFPDTVKSADDPQAKVVYQLGGSENSNLLDLDGNGNLHLRQALDEDVPSVIELQLRAYRVGKPENVATSKLFLTDVTEVKLTYFSQCHYRAHVGENALPRTPVFKFAFRGEVDGVDLLNGTEYFDVTSDGVVTVKTGAVIDYEEVNQIIVKARLKSTSALHPKSLEQCQIASCEVTVDPVNEFTPKFEKPSYTFYAEDVPYNNTEVGTVRATDKDRGKYGTVTYRIMEDHYGVVPFKLFQADGAATLYYVIPSEDFFPEKTYTFSIEAYDSDENARTSRVLATVHLEADPHANNKEESSSSEQETSSGTHLASADEEDTSAVTISTTSVRIRTKNRERQPGHPAQREQLLDINTSELPLKVLKHKKQKKTGERFDSPGYKFTLDGKIELNQQIGQVQLANAPDDVVYSLESGIVGFVTIDPTSGALHVGPKLLDDAYEEVRFSANAHRGQQLVATTLITVLLDDSSPTEDAKPVFEQAIYRFELSENEPPTEIGRVQARHPSVEQGRDRLLYAIRRTTDDFKHFKVDLESGSLQSTKSFDAETKKSYKLQVSACLEANTSQCGDTSVFVVILDVNDNPPHFDQETYDVKILGSAPIGSDVLRINATDADSSHNGHVRYSLEDPASIFVVDEHTGQIRTNRGLDGASEEYVLTVTATDEGDPPISSAATVRITVAREQEKKAAIEFEKFRYSVQRNSPIPAGSEVAQVLARDILTKSGDGIFYRVLDGKENFVIDENTGRVTAARRLTVADGPVLQAVVQATTLQAQMSSSAETVIVLHMESNDEEALKFAPLPRTIFISASKPVGSVILTASLRHPSTSDTEFGVDDGGEEMFMIEGDELRVKSRLREGIFNVTLWVRHRGAEDSAAEHFIRVVVMKDRDKYPVFQKLNYEMKIALDAPFPLKLPSLGASLNEGRLQYTLYPTGEAHDGLTIDSVTGELTVFEEFANSAARESFVVVRATNRDYPDYYSDAGVMLILEPEDGDLLFTSELYRLVVRENAPVGTQLNSVPVSVKDAVHFPGVRYKLEPDGTFAISDNGTIFVKRPLDRSDPHSAGNKGIVDLTVTAVYHKQSAQSRLQIMVDKHEEEEPHFNQSDYYFEVHYPVPPGAVVGRVDASDGDQPMHYRIASGSARNIVEVRTDGYIVKSGKGDFEEGHEYDVKVQAIDANGKTSQTSVRFAVLKAGDASSTSSSSSSNLVDRQSWVPKETREDVKPSYTVHALPKGHWQFRIASGNEHGHLQITPVNATMARIELVEPHIRDDGVAHKEHPVEVVRVEATNMDDPGEVMETELSVNYKEILRAQTPVITADEEIVIDANSPTDKALTRIHAEVPTSKETPLSYTIVENPDNLFRVNSETGELFLNVDPSRVPSGEYDVLLQVSVPGGQSSQKAVSVRVVPMLSPPTTSSVPSTKESSASDEPTTSSPSSTSLPEAPVFTQSQYTFAIEHPARGAEVGRLHVTHPEHHPVRMSIEPPQFRDWFFIDSETGKLFVKEVPTDLEGRQRAEFSVVVQDVDNPRLRSKCFVSVDLILPQRETSSPSNRSDSQTSNVVPVTFSPDSTDIPDIGAETTSQLVEFASSSSEGTTVSSPSSTPPTDESTRLTSASVEVTKGNREVEPGKLQFSASEFSAMLPEGNYGNRGALVNLRPHSLRTGLSSARFSIETPDPSLPFFVRNETGELIAFGEIDREATDHYVFSVTATDLSDPSRQASATVNVKILDVNDNSPHFVGSPTLVGVSKNAPAETVLGRFKAVDGDEGSLGKVSYRMQSNFDDFFGISTEGDLFLRKTLVNVTEDYVNITIAALDGGRPALRATHTVRVEVFSDQSAKPTFKTAEHTHRASVDEQTEGASVTQVVAGSGNYNYALRDSASNLFDIDDRGIISFRRKPLESERNRYHILNVTAQDNAGNSASTTVNVFVEGNPILVTATTPTTASTESAICHFSPNIINTEIKENLPGRQRLVKVTSTCERERRSVMYTIASGSEEFEIDARTGELFVTGSLDREKKGLHFIVVNVVEVDNATALVEGDTARSQRQINPITEYAKSKLNESEALVTVKVQDENDSPPSFNRLNPEGVYVFAVDWQKVVLTAIARVQAFDPDERPHLNYTMSKSDLFAMNSTSGVITILKSLQNVNEERFDLEATVSDGIHKATVPVQIYRLAPGMNIVVVAVDSGVDDIDNLLVERQISTAIGLDFNILAKQVYIGEDEHADPAKTHLFAYALDKKTRRPVDAETLKKRLDDEKLTLEQSTKLSLSSIAVAPGAFRLRLTGAEVVLLGISAVLLVAACFLLFLLLRCFRRKSMEPSKPDTEYMVDSEAAGPRPYNVELITRRTAQTLLSSRPLPDPNEEVAMTPESRASMIATSGIYGTNQESLNSLSVSSAYDDSFVLHQTSAASQSTTADGSSNVPRRQQPLPSVGTFTGASSDLP